MYTLKFPAYFIEVYERAVIIHTFYIVKHNKSLYTWGADSDSRYICHVMRLIVT